MRIHVSFKKDRDQDFDNARNPSVADGFQPTPTGLNAEAPRHSHKRISSLAHQHWEQRGRPRNDDWTDWMAAEAQAEASESA